MVKTLRFAILALFFLPAAAGAVGVQPRLPQVRVAVLRDVGSLRLKVNGYYEVSDPANGNVFLTGRHIKTTVTAYKDGILLTGKTYGHNRILVHVSDPESLFINDRSLRGSIEIIKDASQRLLVVNHIELEDYVKGILYHEVSHYWPEEVLKAQAVVCRTYALYQMQQSADKDFDLTDDIYSQVYGGRASERFRTNKAVDDTRGEALLYKGKIFPAYYHATCAGHTEDAAQLWKIDLPPLKGVVCGFCKDSPHYRWHKVLEAAEVEKDLRKAGYQTGKIRGIAILDKDRSGRVGTIRISFDSGTLDIAAKDFRNIVGPNVIRSTIFEVEVQDGDIVFEGLGWGHGVGMCQWGAYFMAKQGYGYRQILEYYYPQSNVKTFGI